MAHIFSIINHKGGTGKTTTTLNLSAALGLKKKKVLCIDFDGQANLTTSLGIKETKHHVGEVLLGKAKIEDAIIKNGKVDLLPSTDQLTEFETQINNEPGREYLLRECIEKISDKYDFVLIDCAPNLGIFSLNSLVAAQYFIVPMQAENFAFIGLDKILQVSEKVQKRLNPQLDIAGILIVRMSQKTKFSQAVITSIAGNDNFKNKLFDTYIRQDIALMESTAFGQSIFEYAPESRGAEDYKKLANELIKNYGKK